MLEVFRKVGLKTFFQSFKLCLCIVIVALKACNFLQTLKLFGAQGVILEVAFQHKLLEILIVGIAQFELTGRSNRRMAGNIILLEGADKLVRIAHAHKIVSDIGQRVGHHLDVGRDASAVFYGTSARSIEGSRERIGHHFGRAAIVVLIVELLDTAPAGYVILIGSELQLAVIGQVNHALDKALPIGSGAHDDGTVEVLQRTARYFRGRSRAVVDQHDDGQQRIDGLNLRKIVAVYALHLAAIAHNHLAFRHKAVHDVDGFLLRSAAISAQIKH